MSKKQYLKGNLYAVEFFYELEKKGTKDFYSKEEIQNAIKKAINTGIPTEVKKNVK